MSLQITILNTTSQSNGSFTVSGVFWLTAPSNNIVPQPNLKSQVPFIDSTNLASLQSGVIVEQAFNSGLFDSGAQVADVQAYLQTLFTAAQNDLNNTNSPLSGLIGNVYDGYTGVWSSANPFAPADSLFNVASHYTKKHYLWTDFKVILLSKYGALQYYDNGAYYTVYFYDTPEAHLCTIWEGSVPQNAINSGYTQAQNDADKSDFETNYKPAANKAISPRTIDGRPTISPNAFPSWVTLYFTGQADDQTLGIGQGTPFYLSSDGYGDTPLSWQFNDSMFILGAMLVFTGCQLGDTLDYLIYAPATVTGAGSQPVNLYNVGPGNIIMPAAPGQNMTTIDITMGVPVPNQTGTGFWDWNTPITGWGTLVPNVNQKGNWDLFDFQIPLARPALRIPLLGDNQRLEVIVETVTSMSICPQWVHLATLHNSGHTGLQIGWTLAGARAVSV